MSRYASFAQAYAAPDQFPYTCVYQPSLPESLDELHKRRCETHKHMCKEEDGKFKITFRDFQFQGMDESERVVEDDRSLQEYLGDGGLPSLAGLQGNRRTKRDPKCRFVFLYAPSSRQPLRTTWESLSRLLTYHQVMPDHLRHLFMFGKSSAGPDRLFCNFSAHHLSRDPRPELAVDALDRSGRRYQMCYNLRLVAPEPPTHQSWTVRHIGVDHQFDVDKGTAFWMITKADHDVNQRLKGLTSVGTAGGQYRNFSTVEHCFKSTLAVHLSLAHCMGEPWRAHVEWLERDTDAKTKVALHGTSEGDDQANFTSEQLRLIQPLEDQITQSTSIIDGNLQIMESITTFYKDLVKTRGRTHHINIRENVSWFIAELCNIENDLRLQKSKLQVLAKILVDRKALMSQHLQYQSNNKIKDLTIHTSILATKSKHEATIVTIITVVTLCYLPASFISSFLNAGIFQFPEGPHSVSMSALDLWLATTLSLTVGTLIASFLWYQYRRRRFPFCKIPESSVKLKFQHFDLEEQR